MSALTEGSTDYARFQDTGDPRDYGFSDPGSNRKVFFGHDITSEGASDSVLDDGVTISFRARVATGSLLDEAKPDGGGGSLPWPSGGDGYVTHNAGKGNFGIGQQLQHDLQRRVPQFELLSGNNGRLLNDFRQQRRSTMKHCESGVKVLENWGAVGP